jgi:hypothetical protein
MAVVAEIRSAQAISLRSVIGFLRRNEDRIVIAALIVFIVVMTSMVLLLDFAAMQGTETGVCDQRTHSPFGYVFLTMH